jgi:hypothetical protein
MTRAREELNRAREDDIRAIEKRKSKHIAGASTSPRGCAGRSSWCLWSLTRGALADLRSCQLFGLHCDYQCVLCVPAAVSSSCS